MSDGLKTTFSVVGSVILVLFIAFCVGMCTQAFRSKFYDILDVVPESEYMSVSDCNEIITDELKETEAKLLKMTSDKVALEETISNMEQEHNANELVIANYRTQLDILNIQIQELNNRIDELNANMLRISNIVNGIEVSYNGERNEIFYPVFDDNGNLTHFTGAGDSENDYWTFNGADLLNHWNVVYSKMIPNVNKGIEDRIHDIQINVFERYYVNIDGTIFNFNKHKVDYYFDNDTRIDIRITLNNSVISESQLFDEINNNSNYKMYVSFDYVLNGNNEITGCVINTIINNDV